MDIIKDVEAFLAADEVDALDLAFGDEYVEIRGVSRGGLRVSGNLWEETVYVPLCHEETE